MGAMKVLVYEFITEISYPVSPTVATALLHLFSNLIIQILTLASDSIGDSTHILRNTVQFGFIAVLGLCMLAFARYEFVLKRLEVDQSYSNGEEEEVQSLGDK